MICFFWISSIYIQNETGKYFFMYAIKQATVPRCKFYLQSHIMNLLTFSDEPIFLCKQNPYACLYLIITEFALRKHAYSNIQKVSPPKTENFQIKNFDIFHNSGQNIDRGYSPEPPRRGGSNEYPQSMFLSRNKKINVYPCKPQFYYIKVGFKGVKII